MRDKFRIAIAGIGGVGGFYGAKLTSYYHSTEGVEVHFVARGSHASSVRQNGLKLITDTETIIAHPQSIADNLENLGELDLIIFCCKTYDLDSLAGAFTHNISRKTMLLPLLNGVDNTERLQAHFPNTHCLYGCVYLFSKIISQGVVKAGGNLGQLLFGGPGVPDTELYKIEELFTKAGIQASRHNDIQLKLWEKFSFVSPLASLTSATDLSIGRILENENHKSRLLKLMSELVAVAKEAGVFLADDIVERNLEKMSKLPYETTSSMHVDFSNRRRTELETLTGFVVEKAAQFNVRVPIYNEIYEHLKKRAASYQGD